MSELENLKARLANTEKALFALATIISEMTPNHIREGVDAMMCDYFDANISLGFEPTVEFAVAQEN